MTASDTIYALSSGAGRAALAVIRISGGHTASLLEQMCGALPPPRAFALRRIRDLENGDTLDKAVVAWLPGPASFTGEDCCELHLHGSPAVIAAVMDLLSRKPGVRPAEAGEFTRRAFINGKMDLVEAEGLGDLLAARTAAQRRQAFRQMTGLASSVFGSWRDQLLLIRADIEASVDFADEEGVAEAASAGIDGRIRKLVADMEQAHARSASAEIIRDGARVVLAGFPNTGKSSLLNTLAQREAAIVSRLPGTTRDAIEVSLDLGGMPVILTDTAGLRKAAADEVEEEGIRRSWQHIADADVVVWVWSPDVSGSNHPDGAANPDLMVQNKSDLRAAQTDIVRGDCISVSTLTGEGIPALLRKLSDVVRDRFGDVESSLLVSARQKQAALRSIRHLNDALDLAPYSLELKAEEIRRASEEVGRLTGRVGVEEWLEVIFSRFCIGK